MPMTCYVNNMTHDLETTDTFDDVYVDIGLCQSQQYNSVRATHTNVFKDIHTLKWRCHALMRSQQCCSKRDNVDYIDAFLSCCHQLFWDCLCRHFHDYAYISVLPIRGGPAELRVPLLAMRGCLLQCTRTCISEMLQGPVKWGSRQWGLS